MKSDIQKIRDLQKKYVSERKKYVCDVLPQEGYDHMLSIITKIVSTSTKKKATFFFRPTAPGTGLRSFFEKKSEYSRLFGKDKITDDEIELFFSKVRLILERNDFSTSLSGSTLTVYWE